ncbi:50S ribosomal protein L22 [Candidatus Falkowbacteria bacterium CG10_big_fil_rev_8_21_14_0_10_43_10]|uniref:Large ribosomal subunit protein uL22 n=1 Tax=Candidatus Falkowbacteria bacterium CG10_big_fil_rev_8_21_14_0_10_43_10 TaxID=1974567 RepID=A0A2H0V2L5_9BACT|nr:MAG: 50S ribosomal protein L22 [Candidatus Falkowbacteria bacterium CG10_big_fil_rev_8_21_14_0_10_43_10]
MQTTAKAKYVRMSPRKVRLVIDVVRGMKAADALDHLRLMKKAAAHPVMKLLNSAIANAENNFDLARNNLYIKEAKVDEGSTLKRWMPRAHGRATTIRKRNSHIIITLGEIEDTGERTGKKPKAEAPVKLGEMNKKNKEEAEKEIKAEKMKEAAAAKSAADKKKEKGDTFDGGAKDGAKEPAKEIKDPRREGRAGHARAEGGRKGFSSKIFRRKSG